MPRPSWRIAEILDGIIRDFNADTDKAFDRWWTTATDAEKNRAVAVQVMGWTSIGQWDHVERSPDGSERMVAGDDDWVGVPPGRAKRSRKGKASSTVEFLPKYVTDIAAAWEVFAAARGWLFRRRRHFYETLGRLLQSQTADGTGEQVKVAWPDALGFLTPELICRAALCTVLSYPRVQVAPASPPPVPGSA